MHTVTIWKLDKSFIPMVQTNMWNALFSNGFTTLLFCFGGIYKWRHVIMGEGLENGRIFLRGLVIPLHFLQFSDLFFTSITPVCPGPGVTTGQTPSHITHYVIHEQPHITFFADLFLHASHERNVLLRGKQRPAHDPSLQLRAPHRRLYRPGLAKVWRLRSGTSGCAGWPLEHHLQDDRHREDGRLQQDEARQRKSEAQKRQLRSGPIVNEWQLQTAEFKKRRDFFGSQSWQLRSRKERWQLKKL